MVISHYALLIHWFTDLHKNLFCVSETCYLSVLLLGLT